MRSLLSSTTALAVATGGLLLLSGPVAPTTPLASASAPRVATPFALQSSGYGTRLNGGDAPAGSDTTAYDVIGCTNNAGVRRENHEATTTIPGLGTLSGVKTSLWTKRHAGTVSAYSRHHIDRLTLADSPAGSLSVRAISSLSRAYHNGSGFHSTTTTRVGSITLTPTGQDPQQVPVPTPDQPVVVPGLAEISVGNAKTKHDHGGAFATADALRITLLASGSRARIAHSHAAISRGVKHGVFGGHAFGSRARGLDDNLSSGRSPLVIMPCQGTDGALRKVQAAHSDLGDNAEARGLNTKQQGDQTASRAAGFEQGSISRVEFGDGQVLVKGIVARANVARTDSHVTRNAHGTTVGKVLVNGEARKFPHTDVLEIPGVVRLERNIVDRTGNGISVTALRATMLDGTGAVFNLGHAELRIRDSGL